MHDLQDVNRILGYSGENQLLGARRKQGSKWAIAMIHVKQDATPHWCQESMIATDDGIVGFSHNSMRDSTFLLQTLGDFFSLYVQNKSVVFFFFVLTYFKNICFKKKPQPIMAVTKD